MSLRPGSSSQTRKKGHKSGIDADQSRRRREEQLLTVRKNKRQDTLLKKRTQTHASIPNSNNKFLAAIPSMLQFLRSDSTIAQLKATTHFKVLLKLDYHTSIDAVIQAGVIPCFVQFLERFDAPQLQLEAARVLTNIALYTSEHIRAVVEFNAVPALVNLLKSSGNYDVIEQAAWALGNIASDSSSYRDLVLNNDALLPLLFHLQTNSSLTMWTIGTWTLSNLIRGDPPVHFDQVKPALPVLKLIIESTTDEEVLSDACWALNSLSDDGSIDKIQAIVEAEICTKLVELLLSTSDTVFEPVLRTIGNIATGHESHTQVLIDSRLLPLLRLLLRRKHEKIILEEMCWIISNISARNRSQIQAVIDEEIIPHIVGILNDAIELDIKKEAVWAIINVTSGGTHEQIRYLVAKGCIKPLCELLTCPDPNLVSVCLEGLENILVVGEVDKTGQHDDNVFAKMLDECEGWDNIEKLHIHDNSDICNRAVRIVERFWSVEDEVMVADKQKARSCARPHIVLNKHETEALCFLFFTLSVTHSQSQCYPFLCAVLGEISCTPIAGKACLACPKVPHRKSTTNDEVLTDACWALSSLSDNGSIEKIQAIVGAEVCTQLVVLLESKSDTIIKLVLWTLGNIASGDESHIQHLIDSKLLWGIQQLLIHRSHEKIIVEQICWMISNITARNRTQIQAVIEAGIIPQLVGILDNVIEIDIKKEAIRAIINVSCGGSHDQIRYLAAKGCIKPLCELLTYPDPNLVSVCLEGLENILVVGEVDKKKGRNSGNVFAERVDVYEGWNKIEKLLSHDNNDICNRAERIVQRFWAKDDMVEE